MDVIKPFSFKRDNFWVAVPEDNVPPSRQLGRWRRQFSEETGAITFAQDSPGVIAVLNNPVTVTNTLSKTTLLTCTILGGSSRAGTLLRHEMYGVSTQSVANDGNVTIRSEFGTLEVYSSTGNDGSTTYTNAPWYWTGLAEVRTAGATGTICGGGFARYNELAGGAKFDIDGDAVAGSTNLNNSISLTQSIQWGEQHTTCSLTANTGHILLAKL